MPTPAQHPPIFLPAPGLLSSGAAPTMSSLEIAELLGSRHDKVKQSIERLADRGAITLPPLGEVSNPGLGPKTITAFRVSKRDSYVVVAQLSPEFTARLVDRWQELEASARRTMPGSFSEALQLAADQARQIEQQHQLLVEQQPKAAFFDKYVSASGLLGYLEAGTAAGCQPKKFCSWLKTKYCIYRGKKLMPRSQFVTTGLFEIKSELDANGDTHLRGYVTAKGVEYFAARAPDEIRVQRMNPSVKS